ncbi:MAG: low specificity L-threonine aldolase [Planctomycetaceae bacterium]
MTTIDLRSDTVTRPTGAMRQAMANAEVGDDMMGEDPTVNRLEKRFAELFAMESAVFACSGTQSNQMGVRANCHPGDELLINETGHIANFEAGAPAVLSGVTVRTIEAPKGKLDIENLEGRIRAIDQHLCRTRLVSLENTTNIAGGWVYSIDHMARVSGWARENGLRMHLDGARFFNACIAGGYEASDVGPLFDTISICLSKGLGCPMGSILIGDTESIQRARLARKQFGGALRQAGIVAAAAEYAMDHHIDRLAEDHDNAKRFADGLNAIDGIAVEDGVETNLVFFNIDPELGTAVQLSGKLRENNIFIGPMGGQRMRGCTHLDVSADDVDTVVTAIREACANGFREYAVVGAGPYDK